MSGLSVSGFRFHVRDFDFRLNWHRIVHKAMPKSPLLMATISSGDFGILKSKRSDVEFASKVDLWPLIQWSSS